MLITDHLLLNYKRCNRRTYLETYGNHEQKDPAKDFILKLKRENQTHIKQVIERRSLDCQQPAASRRNWQLNTQQTIALMRAGASCIFRGTLSLTFTQWQSVANDEQLIFLDQLQQTQPQLLSPVNFIAAPSLLLRQPGKSDFGDWEYIPLNIKLGRRAKPEYKLISAFHAQILSVIQGSVPAYSQLVLKEHNDYYPNLDLWLAKMQQEVTNCLTMLVQQQEPEVFISRQRCSLCSWYSHCHEIAKTTRHLSLVPGVTPKRYEQMQTIGVNSVESLVNISEDLLGDALDVAIARQIKQQITALQSDSALVKSSFDLINTQPVPSGVIELYFDIEAEPERQIDYLLGILLVDRSNNTEQFYAFVAEDPADEGKIWQEFLDFVAKYPDAPIYHYSEYEADTIKRLGRLYDTPKSQIKEVLSRLVDLHWWVSKTVVLPVESYSLKALANWIGFHWRETEGSGDQSVCWYDQWLNTNNRQLLELILSYNEDDCRATRYLKDWLLDFLEYQRNQKILTQTIT